MATGKTYPGVAVMQIGPAQGHTLDALVGGAAKKIPLHIDATTLSQIADAANKFKNGVKVKDGHDGKVSDIVGSATNFSIDGDTLRADLTVNTGTESGAAIAAAIETIPDTFGLSAKFGGEHEVIGEKAYARCQELNSIDFEPETAATSGMFSSGVKKFCFAVDNKKKNMNPDEFAAYKTACEARFAKLEDEVKAAKGATPPAGVPGQTAQMGDIKSVVSAALGEATPSIIALAQKQFLTELSKIQGLARPVAGSPDAAGANVPDPSSGSPSAVKFEDLVKTTLKNGQAKTTGEAIQFCYKNYPNESRDYQLRLKTGQTAGVVSL